MPQSFAAVHLHIAFSTKGREPTRPPDLIPRLREYTAGIMRDHGCVLSNANGVPDHVHLLASLGRTITIADLVKTVKAGTSRWIHDTFADLRHFHWQEGYGAFSVSPSQLATVNRYIDRQPEHHRTRDFQDEFRKLLSAHGLGWDERYVWD
jgi:putative transposase